MALFEPGPVDPLQLHSKSGPTAHNAFDHIREVAQLVIVAPCTVTFQSAHPAQALLALEGKVPSLAPQPSDTKPSRRGQQEDPFRADKDLKRSHSSQRSGQDRGPLLSVTGTYLL